MSVATVADPVIATLACAALAFGAFTGVRI